MPLIFKIKNEKTKNEIKRKIKKMKAQSVKRSEAVEFNLKISGSTPLLRIFLHH